MTIHNKHQNRAWIELNWKNLHNNVAVLRSILPQSCELMPAVKANAYGHGAVEVCRELNKLNVYAFCVATVAEGVELRKARIKGEILVLGYTHPQQFDLLKRYRLTQTVVDYSYAQLLETYGKDLPVHLKIDTGMRRLGTPSEDIQSILSILQCRHLVTTGFYTHFSTQSDSFTQAQVQSFSALLSYLRELGYFEPLVRSRKGAFLVPKVHAQSSYGVLAHPLLSYDYARVGIALYGAYGDVDKTGRSAELRPVLAVKARISMVKTVAAGEAIGYGAACIAPRPMRIALLAIGYADGIPRQLSCGVGKVLLRGHVAPIIGNVCMDQTIVDVTSLETVRQGDSVTILGRDGNEEITALDLALQTNSVPNEILSRLGSRLERPCR